MASLKVRARGRALVVDYEAMSAGARRFVGRKHDPELGPNGGWPVSGEGAEVPDRGEYRKAVAKGDLWAADEATARLCGVQFDPDFGGEVHEGVTDHG